MSLSLACHLSRLSEVWDLWDKDCRGPIFFLMLNYCWGKALTLPRSNNYQSLKMFFLFVYDVVRTALLKLLRT